jgi:hypothetical protein
MPGMKYIGCITSGVQALAKEQPEMLDKLLRAFSKEVHSREDWFYQIEVDGKRFFVADNGKDGYTAMLPEEY